MQASQCGPHAARAHLLGHALDLPASLHQQPRQLAALMLSCHCLKSPLVTGALSPFRKTPMPLLCLFPTGPQGVTCYSASLPASALSYRAPAKDPPSLCFGLDSHPPESTKRAWGHSTVDLKQATASRPHQALVMLPQAGQDPLTPGRVLRQSLTKPASEVPNQAVESAVRTASKHLQALWTALTFLPWRARYKCFSDFPGSPVVIKACLNIRSLTHTK